MKKIIFTMLLLFITVTIFSQTFTNNQNPVGMEHNLLFNATTRYQVSQAGNAVLNTKTLFDGRFGPSYTSKAPTNSSPTVILIENLPSVHTQSGAWVGWSTRYWQAKRFKIEGYNSYSSANVWKTIADYSTQDYTGGAKFIKKIPSGGAFTKLRFTFYSAYGTNGRLGVSELFFLHPEAMSPYQGLLGASNDTWSKSGNDILYNKGRVDISVPATSFESFLKLKAVDAPEDYLLIKNATGANGQFIPSIMGRHVSDNRQALYLSGYIKEENDKGNEPVMVFDSRIEGKPLVNRPLFGWDTHGQRKMILGANGNLGIGTADTKGFKLGVNGKIAATEVKVAAYANWADFVFEKEYDLPTLTEVENHIKKKGHLQNIPSASEVKKDGFFLGEMDAKLLQKIEELTLYTIQQEKQLKKQAEEVRELKELVNKLIQKNK